MRRLYYDLHLHSCLSPCGDDDMTPANIVGMAHLNGLQLLALTDHNSVKNAPAFCSACEKMGIIPIPGMELTTAEDIHIVVLFRTLEDALTFDSALEQYRILYKNPVDIYGHQFVLDEHDEVVCEEPYLLSNALMLSLSDAVTLARTHNALVYPAHIDREANGIISILGAIPEELGFTTVEFHNADAIDEYTERYHLEHMHIVVSSDAHYLWDIQDANQYFDVSKELTSDEVRHFILSRLEESL